MIASAIEFDLLTDALQGESPIKKKQWVNQCLNNALYTLCAADDEEFGEEQMPWLRLALTKAFEIQMFIGVLKGQDDPLVPSLMKIWTKFVGRMYEKLHDPKYDFLDTSLVHCELKSWFRNTHYISLLMDLYFCFKEDSNIIPAYEPD